MTTGSNLGKWDKHYANASQSPMHYGNSASYRLGAEALADCAVVEDWGCGLGWFKLHLSPVQHYVGVDGSHSPHADIIDDLATRQTEVEGIYMRHVLEHNYLWRVVLDNALASFTRRFVLVTFTPFIAEQDVAWEEKRFEDDYGVPTLSLNLDMVCDAFEDFRWTYTEIESPETFYGAEAIFVVEP